MVGRWTILVLLVFLSLLTSTSAIAEQPRIAAVELETPPNIDGDLSDSCWNAVPPVQDFFVMVDGARPCEETRAWICYDQKNIYAAFLCKDSQPEKVSARETRRGSDGIFNDDCIELNIDCFENYDPIWVDVSALGTQAEHLQSGDVSKIEWRGDWKAAAKRSPEGYTIEIAIPWSILQYDPQKTSMGVAFARSHSRSASQWWSSPNLGRNWDGKKFYKWDGLHLPSYNKKPLYLAYTCIGGGNGGSFGSSGVDIKKSFTPKTTGVLSINPDYRDLEQQVANVDFSYTEKYLDESRPFFQEGYGFFPGSDLFYTRRISQIDYGGKFQGTMGDYNLGLMHAQGQDSAIYDVARVSRLWAGKGHLEFAAVNGRQAGDGNLSGMVAGDWLLYDKNWRKMTLSSDYETAGSGGGLLGRKADFRLSTSGPAKTLEWSVSHQEISENFDPLLGYIPEKDLSSWKGSVHISDDPTTGPLSNWALSSYILTVDHLGGGKFHNDIEVGSSCRWRNDTYGSLFLDGSDRPPYHDSTISLGYGWKEHNQYRNGVVFCTLGRKSGGRYRFFSISQNWDIAKRFLINGYYGSSRISAPSPNAYRADQAILSLTYQIDSERAVSTRVVDQTGKVNVFLAYRQRVRAGMDAYLLFGDPNADSTRNIVTVKLVRPLF